MRVLGFILVSALSATTACTFNPGILAPFIPTPTVKRLSWFPKYFCSPSQVTFEWEASDIDEFSILDRSGVVIFHTAHPNGMHIGSTPPITGDSLPLKVRAKASGEVIDRVVDTNQLVNIDNPAYTEEFLSTQEVSTGQDEKEWERNEIHLDPTTNTLRQVAVYRLYRSFVGYEWTIPAFAFGPNARVDRIRSNSPINMTYFLHNGGESVYVLGLTERALTNTSRHPAMRISGRRGTPDRRRIGTQWGEEIKNPPDPLF